MGPPLATAIASTVNVWLLYSTLRKRGHFVPDARLKRRWWRLALAALAMGVVIWFLQAQLMPYTHGAWTVRAAALAVLVAGGGLVYAVATFALGAFSRDDLQFLRRRRAAAQPDE
jgi:putative peptidoglycan lipid II flippase